MERLGEELTLAIRWARYYGRLGEIGMGDLYERFCMGVIGGRLLGMGDYYGRFV